MPSVFINEDTEFLNSRIFKTGSITALENATTVLIRAKLFKQKKNTQLRQTVEGTENELGAVHIRETKT